MLTTALTGGLRDGLPFGVAKPPTGDEWRRHRPQCDQWPDYRQMEIRDGVLLRDEWRHPPHWGDQWKVAPLTWHRGLLWEGRKASR